MGEKKLLWIIPAYNEAKSLDAVVEDILSADPKADYIIVSDGSTDGTVELCQKKGYSYLALPENLGLTACFQTGMRYADQRGYAYALQFDGDGQHRAEDVAALLEEAENGVDIVCGSRFLEKKKGGSLRDFGSALISLAILLRTGTKLTDPTCGLRFSRERNFSPEPDTLAHLLLAGMTVSEVPVKIRERREGESYLKPWNAAKYMTRVLLSILFFGNTKI